MESQHVTCAQRHFAGIFYGKHFEAVRKCNFPCEMSRFLFSVIFHVLVTFPAHLGCREKSPRKGVRTCELCGASERSLSFPGPQFSYPKYEVLTSCLLIELQFLKEASGSKLGNFQFWEGLCLCAVEPYVLPSSLGLRGPQYFKSSECGNW